MEEALPAFIYLFFFKEVISSDSTAINVIFSIHFCILSYYVYSYRDLILIIPMSISPFHYSF